MEMRSTELWPQWLLSAQRSARVDKGAVSSDVQHDGSTPPQSDHSLLAKPRRDANASANSRHAPMMSLISKALTSFVDSKQLIARSSINMNLWTPRSHLVWLSRGHLSSSRRLPLLCRLEQVQVGLALHQLLRLPSTDLPSTRTISLASLSLPCQMRSISGTLSCLCRVSVPWGRAPI